MVAASPPIRAFLSYSHKDEEVFSFVDPLISKMKAFVLAKGGRELDVFVDRTSIGWGADWRTSISDSVDNATIFIPLLTANYLDSEACREEFLAFHAKAEVSGVTELLLPILLLESPLFGAGSTDEVAQIAEALQYKCIEDALLQGYQSPIWLQCTNDLAESLLAALTSAEDSLSANPPAVPVAGEPSAAGDGAGEPAEPAEPSGLAEVMAAIESAVDQMTEATEKLTPALEELGEVPTSIGDPPDEPNSKQITIWTVRLAEAFKKPSNDLEKQGRELFEATKNLDEALLKLAQLIDTLDENPEFAESLVEGHRNVINGFGDIRSVADSMNELLTQIKPAEMLSVPLRKSLQPARRGLTAVRDSLNLIESWQAAYGTE